MESKWYAGKTPGEMINYLRVMRAYLTQYQVGVLCGTSAGSVSKWEADRHLPAPRFREALFLCLKMTDDEKRAFFTAAADGGAL